MESFVPVLIIFFILYLLRLYRHGIRRHLLYKKIHRKGTNIMSEMLQRFIGKYCAVYSFDDSFGVVGEITALTDGWMEIKTKNGVKLLNVEYIKMVEERPVKKK